MHSLRETDFKALARKQKSIQMKMRLLALAHFQEGHSRTQIAQFLKVSRASINKWVSIYLSDGIEDLYAKPRTGSPHFLTKPSKNSSPSILKKCM